MAEAFVKFYYPEFEVYSAGTNPAKEINPYAVRVMNEVGIDISKQYPKSVDNFINDEFDYVITCCDGAKENCPVFTGKVKNRVHIGFIDPAEAKGSEDEILDVFRTVRDEIKIQFKSFFDNLKVNKNK
jgi:arsenate reductase